MSSALLQSISQDGPTDSGTLLGRFLEDVERRRLQLYPAQEAAILELYDEKNVILNTPTGSGKSLVAAALHFKRLAQGGRSIYTLHEGNGRGQISTFDILKMRARFLIRKGGGLGNTGARPRRCNPAAGLQRERQWCADMKCRAEGTEHRGECGCSASERRA